MWRPSSYHSFKSYIQYFSPKDSFFHDFSSKIKPIVQVSQIQALKKALRLCQQGKKIYYQAGDCAQPFNESGEKITLQKAESLFQGGNLLASQVGLPAVIVGRIAGQYAKPRSQFFQKQKLNNYFGDMVNSTAVRTIDHNKLILANQHSMSVYSALRKYKSATIFTSHQGLVLPYEEALTEQAGNEFYCRSASLLWIGERTRQVDGAHVQFFRGLANPVGIKISSKIDVPTFLTLFQKLNRNNESGKLVVITRLGAEKYGEQLNAVRAIAELKRSQGLNFLIVSDPMHGNGETLNDGTKTRRLSKIKKEVAHFWEALKGLKINAGLHIETCKDEVTQCVTEADSQIKKQKYLTQCDPRLNPAQTKLVIGQFVQQRRINYL